MDDSRKPEFVSVRGRVYSVREVRGIVLGLVRKRWRGLLAPDWIARVDRVMSPEFFRFHNGEVPASLARAVEDVAIGLAEPPGHKSSGQSGAP